MRRLLLALVLASSPVLAGDYLSGDELMQAAASCTGGCVVMTQEDAEKLIAELHELAELRAEVAFKRGLQTCRNAI